MGIFELNLTMPEDFLLLAIIPSILQFAINTSKPPAPVALEGRLCQSAKPHEVKRSLVWLNLPYPAKLGIPRARWPPLSISLQNCRFLVIFLGDQNHIENLYHHAVPLN